MSKTVTFSFSSTKYENVEATETFTFEKLGIDEDMDDQALIEEVFQAWVWDQLNLSFSIVIAKDKRT